MPNDRPAEARHDPARDRTHDRELARRLASKVKLLVLDVDGVLTDGGLYYDAEGRIMKRFDVQDGLGMKMAQEAGLKLAVITGLDSPAVSARIRELGVTDYHFGHTHKPPLLESIRVKHGLEFAQMAYLGDDWVDVSVMRMVGLPLAVANAQPEVKRLAAWVTGRGGGHGAVREAIAFILEARGLLEAQWRRWGG
ncbi:MAG: KdsC family phosphatase [Desulfovibrionaceae bacterium]